MSLTNPAPLWHAAALVPMGSQSESPDAAPNSGEYRIRTASEAVLGCMFTVALLLCYCTRPNISAPNKSQTRLFFRKLRVAFWMVMFPELVIGWAVRQWIEAKSFARRYHARGWTTAHGYFAVMGGFILFQNGSPVQALSPSLFTMLIDIGCINFPSITSEDLQGKSKVHPVLTAITLLQTLWFTVQCIARGVRGLAITPLEMITVALGAMNALLVVVWWHKPLDARDFVRLDLTNVPRPLNLDSHWHTSISRDFSRERRIIGTGLKAVSRLESPLYGVDSPARTFKKVFMGPLDLFLGLLGDYGELRSPNESTRIRDGVREVPVFYSEEMSEPVTAFSFCATNVVGSLFAAAHASMWFYDFPSQRDMMVWRIATVVSASVPMFFVVATFLFILAVAISLLISNRLSSAIVQATQLFVTIVAALGFTIGTAARIGLFVEAFLSVNGVAMVYVRWTDYIPHIS